MKVRYVILSFSVIFASLPLLADAVILRTGQTINGTIVAQNRRIVRIKTDAGVKTLPKTTIRRIIFGAVKSEAERKKDEEKRRAELKKKLEKRQELLKKQQEAREEYMRKLQEQQEARENAGRPSVIPEQDPISPGAQSLWRSVLFPGWGQFHQDRDGAGAIYAASFGAALVGTLAAAAEADAARGTYESSAQNLYFSVVILGAGMPFYDSKLSFQDTLLILQYQNLQDRNAAFRNAGRAGANLNAMGGLLGAIYLANLVDVILFQPSDQISFRFYAGQDVSGFGVQMTW